MQLADLEYYISLVETGSYTTVAQRYGISQPAVSRAIMRLTKQYETELLTRHRGGVVTSDAGKILYKRAKQIVSLVGETNQEVRHAGEQLLRLGYSTIAGNLWMPAILTTFIQNGLIQRVHTVNDYSANLWSMLTKGKLDAVVYSSLVADAERNMQVLRKQRQDFSIIVSTRNPISNHESVTASELRNEQFITRRKGHLVRSALERYCSFGGFHPKIIYEARDMDMITHLVERNLGIALLMDVTVQGNPRIRKVRLRQDEQLHYFIKLAVRRSFIPNEIQSRCLTILKQVRFD
ncbi:LysR family transcriptional regulator [Ligilactobacillus sp. LYQ139]|uniref:LysR family transcriptional regulator n=1 Tax=Ligilactobacillus sp. LYQ139 TaxID=3378800 RepID=UPI00385541AE